jgi:hypothetical protein
MPRRQARSPDSLIRGVARLAQHASAGRLAREKSPKDAKAAEERQTTRQQNECSGGVRMTSVQAGGAWLSLLAFFGALAV